MNSKTLWRSSILVVSRERRWYGQLELVRTFPSRRRDRAVPQSWNMSSLFKSVKIFEPWFHVIETWVICRIWRISNPKQLAQIIQHLTGLVFLHAGGAEKAIFITSSSDNQRSTLYVLPQPCTTWQLATLQTNFAPTVKEWLKCCHVCSQMRGGLALPPLSLSLRARARVCSS